MKPFSYDDSPISVRDELAAAHRRAWARLARPGRWWTGAQRVAIAAETRHAPACPLCHKRKSALSPYLIRGDHDRATGLADPLVELIHRVRTDPGRLTRTWYEGLRHAGLDEGEYVEAVGVIATVVAIDTFARGLGIVPRPLPAAEAGEPTRRRPPSARPGGAWVPWVEAAEVGEGDRYPYPADGMASSRSLSTTVPGRSPPIARRPTYSRRSVWFRRRRPVSST